MDLVHRCLIPALWLAWLAYWLAAARGTKTSVRSESAVSRSGHVLPLALAAWLIAAPSPTSGLLGGSVVAAAAPMFWFGACVLAAGLGFAILARRHLGRNWSGIVTVKQDHELVRGGPYRWVRHPIYTGILLAFLGSALALDEWRGLLAVPLAWFALWRKLKLEERWMVEQFGEAYRRFQAEVPALVPNPFRNPAASPP